MAGGCAFHLSARPKPPWKCLLRSSPGASSTLDWEMPYTPGETAKLGLAEWSERDGLVYVPESYCPDEPSPVVLALHGDFSSAADALAPLLPFAEEHRLILAAPESRGTAWDKDCEVFNEDVAFIDRALEVMFDNYCVKQEKVGLAGFSGGASFALDLGVPNGPVFSHIMAFGPTEVEGPCYEDGPEIFVSYPKDTAHVCTTCKAGRGGGGYTTSTGPGTPTEGSTLLTSASSPIPTSSSSKVGEASSASGMAPTGTRAGGSPKASTGGLDRGAPHGVPQGVPHLPVHHILPHRLLPRLRSWGPRCTVHPFTLRTTCGAPHPAGTAPLGLNSLSPPGSPSGIGTPQGRWGGRGGSVGGPGPGQRTGVGYTGGVPGASGGGWSVEEMFPREVVASAVDWFAKGKGSCPGFAYNNYEFWEKPMTGATKGCQGDILGSRLPTSKSAHV